MSILDRFRLPDNGWNNSLYALTAPAKVIAIKPIVESHPDRPPQELIEGYEDEICNIADECGLSAYIRITYMAKCRSCGEDWEVDIDDVGQFDPSMSYCGRNQFCLP